jgi:CRISPR-associated protein Csb2
MLAIAWQYLTGRCVAADFADRETAEWPPHPDRVFQAMVAAWGERGEDEAEHRALEWLESLDSPSLTAPEPDDRPHGVGAYVPVNDIETTPRQWMQADYGDKLLAILPSQRSKKERYYPYTAVGDSICALIWREAEPGPYRPVLDVLCAAIIRIGHSMSFVRCWVTDKAPPPTYRPASDGGKADVALRVMERGRLSVLRSNHQRCIERGRYSPPSLARQMPYVRVGQVTPSGHGAFAAPLIVFTQGSGARFTLHQTLDLAQALRATLIPHAEAISAEAREIVSGHAKEGTALRAPHVAFLPLAHVGHEHADGHLLGMALAVPLGLGPDQEEDVYRSMARAMDEKQEMQLNLGRKGEMRLRVEDRSVAPQALQSITWCRESKAWATVTPIVLDRMAKVRAADLDSWVAEQIRSSCDRQGLPVPLRVDLSPVPFLVGSSPCFRRKREGARFRGGGGHALFFPPLIRKDGQCNWMFHARLSFATPVAGPMILGAGRYRGYGLLKPIPDVRPPGVSC